jgi:hypothetical protein
VKTLVRQDRLSRKPTTRRGAATVEFAVVAPLFLLMLAGIIEFGQAFRIQHALSNASRRGARAGIVDGATSTKVTEKVKAQCKQILGVDEADIEVVVTVNGDPAGDLSLAEQQDEIGVKVSIPFCKAGAGFFANTFSESILSSTCIYEHE